ARGPVLSPARRLAGSRLASRGVRQAFVTRGSSGKPRPRACEQARSARGALRLQTLGDQAALIAGRALAFGVDPVDDEIGCLLRVAQGALGGVAGGPQLLDCKAGTGLVGDRNLREDARRDLEALIEALYVGACLDERAYGRVGAALKTGI